MHILHVLDHSIPLHSGYAFRTRAILREQRRLGWTTSQVTSAKQGDAPAEIEEVDGLAFHRVPPATGVLGDAPVLRQLVVIRDLARRLAGLVDTERPDAVHVHSPALNGIAAIRVCRPRGVPVVYECRALWEDAAVDHGTSAEWGPRYRATRALETWVLRRADAVTTICEGLRAEILSRGVPAEEVTVIPNAVDVEKFAFADPRDETLARALGLHGRPVVGFLGSFYAYEGLRLLLEAMAKVVREQPDAALLLVGGGEEADRLAARTRELGLESSVVFTGRVPHGEVERYYSVVDVLAYPRMSMRLTEMVTPLKPLEAMAKGKIVVASDVGGHRELIADAETGWLFRAGDAGALAERLLAVLGSRDRWPDMAARARRFVERERGWPSSVERYRPVYEGLLGPVLDARARA